MTVKVAALQGVPRRLAGNTAKIRCLGIFELTVSRPVIRPFFKAQHLNRTPFRNVIGMAPRRGAILGLCLRRRSHPAKDIAHQSGLLRIVADFAMDIVCARGNDPDFRARGRTCRNQRQ